MGKDERIKEIQTAYVEATSAWDAYFKEAKEDWKFKMSDQWADEDKVKLTAKGLPMLSINHIFKNINLLSGYQRQNRGEMKVYPIEGGDDQKAEVLNMVIKWLLTDRNANFVISEAFKDALIGGVGWLHPYRIFDDDPLCGDIVVDKESPFNMLPDPHFTKRDLSDCDYIIRHRLVSRQKLARNYPKYAKRIKDMAGNNTQKSFTENVTVPSDQGNLLKVVEYWYRDYVNVTMIVMPDGSVIEFTGAKEDLDPFLAAHKPATAVKTLLPRIKMSVLIEDALLVEDGPSPFGGNYYPFIPIFAFYESSYSDWKLKLQGLVRVLKDLQREKNKRRSQIMQAINTMPHSGWVGDKGAVDDKSLLMQAAGAGRYIEKNPGKALEPIRPPDIPASLIQMEQMFDNDIQVVGNNPDMLGMMNERGAPGVTIQLRQRQGLTSVQEVFDSLSDATRTLGRHLIRMISENFTTEKIKRIVGDDFVFTKKIKEIQAQLKELQMQVPVVPEIPMETDDQDETVYQAAQPQARAIMEEQKMQERELQQEYAVNQQMYRVRQQAMILVNELKNVQAEEKAFWEDFDKLKNSARYDVTIDETVGSPTYRASVFSALGMMQQYGTPVPPEMLIDYMEIPKSSKDRYLQLMKQREEMAMQQQQQEQFIQQQVALQKAAQQRGMMQ